MATYDGTVALLGSIAFMAAAAIMVGLAGYLAFATLWRLAHEPAPGTLGAMLAREGVDWSRLACAASVEEFALGLNRCAECSAKAECAEWLASARHEGYQRFCPNAAFVERVKKAAAR